MTGLYCLDDVDNMVSFFTTNLTNPLVYKRNTSRSLLWLTDAIRRLIRLKRRALSRYLNNRSDSTWLSYRRLRNLISSSIRHEKKSFLNSILLKRSPRDF